MTLDSAALKAYENQPVFATEQSAEHYARLNGGGWIHRLFTYDNRDIPYNYEIERYTIKPGAQRIYKGWHVCLYSTVKLVPKKVKPTYGEDL